MVVTDAGHNPFAGDPGRDCGRVGTLRDVPPPGWVTHAQHPTPPYRLDYQGEGTHRVPTDESHIMLRLFIFRS